MTTEEMVADLLIRGADDWVCMSEVAWVAKSIGGAASAAEIQSESLGLIAVVIEEGLMVPGDVTADGFQAWEVSSVDALRVIEHAWMALGRQTGDWRHMLAL
ncbi:MAG: hypothetical protein ABIZ57_12055 [Candidatus Limnocylindria bacterium]